MKEFRSDEGSKPGTWKKVLTAGRVGAEVTCPVCSARTMAGAATKYAITENGMVSPIVHCLSCFFSDVVWLVGWR